MGGGGRVPGGERWFRHICRVSSYSDFPGLSDRCSGRGKQASGGSQVLEQACCPACV